MQRHQLLYDGLWHCLCPAFNRRALSRAIQKRDILPPPGRPATRRSIPAQSGLSRPRCYTTTAVEAPRVAPSPVENEHHSEAAPPTAENDTRHEPSAPESQVTPVNWPQVLLNALPPSFTSLESSSTENIVKALLWLREPTAWSSINPKVDRHSRIIHLVHYLLASKRLTPNSFVYECLFDAMADPKGLADAMRRLMDDLAQEGLKPTAAMCHSALNALMNHPDYYMRESIVDTMKEYWFTVETPQKESIVVAMLREEQYELAYSRLTQMIEDGVKLSPWVYDIFILVFGKAGFLDEMLLLLHRQRKERLNDPTFNSLIYYALDVCSQAYNYPGTLFAWNAIVKSSILPPPLGIIENVLGTAARHADVSLATEALNMLSAHTKARPRHYEAVVEASAASGDLASAFSIIGVMRGLGIRITRGHTRTISKIMKHRLDLIEVAEQEVKKLSERVPVPRQLLSAVIEVMAEKLGSERAMDLYRQLPELCRGEQPSAVLIQNLFMHSKEEQTAKGLAKDYSATYMGGVEPIRSTVTYNLIISKCAEFDEMDLAFHFAKQALEFGVSSQGSSWIKQLLDKAVTAEDSRIWPVVDELGRSKDPGVRAHVQKLLQQQRIAITAQKWRERVIGQATPSPTQ